jgi:hypothetical protein
MELVWGDDGVSDAFASAFESWVDRADGEMVEGTDTRLRAEFEATDTQMMTGVGVYAANGRHMLRFETVREELELKMLTRFEVAGDQLIVQSDKGSRTFSFDAGDGEWRVEKYPV